MGNDIECSDRTSGAEGIELDTLSRNGKVAQCAVQLQTVESVNTPGDTPSASNHSRRATVQFVACCWMKMLSGWSDGSSGPLIPRLQEVYGVNFTVVSLIFITACIGFLTGAFLNVPLTDRFGFGKVAFFSTLCQVLVFSLQAIGLPFPAYVALFIPNGIGLSLQDAQSVTYVASLKENSEWKMMLMMASYGAGAFTAPLVATQFATMRHWSFHYLVSLGLSVINTALVGFAFNLKDLDTCLTRIGNPPGDHDTNARGKFQQILRLKTAHLLAIFTLVYVGTEVTIGGWIVTFIQKVRDGGPSSGYISSGFFGGMMVGRLALTWANQKLGDRVAMYLYTAIAISLELVVWLVPSLIGDAVAVSFVGFVLGPMYPIVMSYAGRVLPRWLLGGCVGWIAGLGQAGSAILPFITGAVANKAGIATLQPMVVGMLVSMLGLWTIVPNIPRRMD
ncbi:MFS general substrate transporter [Hymenopellis radicata]|nr:MFS general substrate transporter [Hymenopellis radicata]